MGSDAIIHLTERYGLQMEQATKDLLNIVSDWDGKDDGRTAFNIRENCASAGRASTEHIKIESKEDAPGLNIRVLPGTAGEKVYIPACITKAGVDDLVYNDFYIAEGADVTIVAGCGIHTETGEPARHNGIHRFFLEKNSHVLYLEKHVGTGFIKAKRSIDPVTEAWLADRALLEMETSQLGGVQTALRNTKATLEGASSLVIREHLLTDSDETLTTNFDVVLNGDGSSVNLVSRSVARGESYQEYHSNIVGNAKCSGHSECDAIITDHGKVTAQPALTAANEDAALIHEAAIGKIAGEQILKLRTLGLTESEAEAAIINGFLK